MKRKIEFKAWIPALNMFLTGFTIHQRSEMIGIHADDLEEQLAAKGYEIDDNGDVRVINDTEDEDLPALPSTSFLCGEDYYWYDKEFELCQYADLLDTENAPIFEGHILTIPEFYETPEMTHTNFINWVVVFKHGTFTLENNTHKSEIGESTLHQEYESYDGNFRVIGNIYENPELLTNLPE